LIKFNKSLFKNWNAKVRIFGYITRKEVIIKIDKLIAKAKNLSSHLILFFFFSFYLYNIFGPAEQFPYIIYIFI